MTRVRASLRLCALLLVAACSSTQVDPIGERGPDLGNYTAEEIVAEAKGLLAARNVPDRDRSSLLETLDETLAANKGMLEQPGVTGVAVFHSASGGFIYAAGGGDGLASFKGGGSAVPFEVSGYKIGGTVGGGGHDGIALVLGLRDQRRFLGNYSTKGTSATGAVTEAGGSVATYLGENGHEIRWFATGYGLEASATVGRFTIKNPEPKPK
ncbi:MAG TPA: hypothetical protein VFZ65_13070 [Planctomycetota bacterium]|nr:hypothetical protein [Planctomycetota bacterium]